MIDGYYVDIKHFDYVNLEHAELRIKRYRLKQVLRESVYIYAGINCRCMAIYPEPEQ